MTTELRLCKEIDKNTRIFYSPRSNEFLVNGETAIPVSMGDEVTICEIVELGEIAGMPTNDILNAVACFLLKNI